MVLRGVVFWCLPPCSMLWFFWWSQLLGPSHYTAYHTICRFTGSWVHSWPGKAEPVPDLLCLVFSSMSLCGWEICNLSSHLEAWPACLFPHFSGRMEFSLWIQGLEGEVIESALSYLAVSLLQRLLMETSELSPIMCFSCLSFLTWSSQNTHSLCFRSRLWLLIRSPAARPGVAPSVQEDWRCCCFHSVLLIDPREIETFLEIEDKKGRFVSYFSLHHQPLSHAWNFHFTGQR